MFFLTQNKVIDLHYALDQLGYRKNNSLDFDDFSDYIMKILTRAIGTGGMNEIFNHYLKICDNWDILVKLSSGQHKLSEFFKSLKFSKITPLKLLTEEEAQATVVVTNALNRKEFEISVFDSETYYEIKKEDGKIRIDIEDWEYYIGGSILSSYKFNLFTKGGDKLFQITCDKDLDILTKNNESSIDVLYNEDNGLITIINEDRDKDDQEIAYIYSDILEKGKYGACQIDFLTNIDGKEWEVCILIGMCTFLIYNRKLKSDEGTNLLAAWYILNR